MFLPWLTILLSFCCNKLKKKRNSIVRGMMKVHFHSDLGFLHVRRSSADRWTMTQLWEEPHLSDFLFIYFVPLTVLVAQRSAQPQRLAGRDARRSSHNSAYIHNSHNLSSISSPRWIREAGFLFYEEIPTYNRKSRRFTKLPPSVWSFFLAPDNFKKIK